ncbi:hypothetical protein GCM10008944_01440 [Cytobacillus oceanisediminis]
MGRGVVGGMSAFYAVTLTAHGNDAEETTKAAEVMGRALVGLGLEGINAHLSVLEVEDDDDE